YDPPAPVASLFYQVRRHRVITRIIIAVLALALAAAVSLGGAAQAALTTALPQRGSILPVGIGVGIGTDQAVTMGFAHAMDQASVEAALSISPSHAVDLRWSADGRSLRLIPNGLWSPD